MAPRFAMKKAKAPKSSGMARGAKYSMPKAKAAKPAAKPAITNGSKAKPSAMAMQHANANAAFKRVAPAPAQAPAFGSAGGAAGNFSGGPMSGPMGKMPMGKMKPMRMPKS